MKKRPPTKGLVKLITKFYFNNLGDVDKVRRYVDECSHRGFDMDIFYWVDKEINPSEKELREILNGEEYGFTEQEIEEYLYRFKNRN